MKKTKLMAVFGLAACMFAACDDDVSSAGKSAEGDSAHVVDTLYMFSKDTVVIRDSVFVSDTVVVMDSLILWDTLYLNDSTIKKDSSCIVTEQGDNLVNPNCMAASEGRCTACKNGYYGPSCENIVTCMHGRAYGGIEGDGKCISCEAGYYGENCDKAATCDKGTVSLGIDGTGLCVSCNAGYRLENGACVIESAPANPGCSAVSDDHCTACKEGYHGPFCDPNTCQHGIASEGLYGDGFCVPNSCEAGWSGSNCDIEGACAYADENTGRCLTCSFGFVLNDGKCIQEISSGCAAASGIHCTACKNGYYGPSCEYRTTCKHGQAYGGLYGDGLCVPGSCEGGWAGSDCDQCAEGYSGENCDIKG